MDEQGKTPIIEFKDVKFSYDRQKSYRWYIISDL